MAKQMTRHEAWEKAHALWGNPASGLARKIGLARIRRKSAVSRYEVGYRAPRGSYDIVVIFGKGDSWEQAFEDARMNPEAP